MTNTSGLDPRGVAVLIEPYEPQKKGMLIEIPDQVKDRMAMLENRVVVIAIGPSAWQDEGYWKPFFFGIFRRWVVRPRAKVGEKVFVTKLAGFTAKGPADGKQYRLINDRDVFCAITSEE